MYLFTTLPHSRGHWQLHELLWNLYHPEKCFILFYEKLVPGLECPSRIFSMPSSYPLAGMLGSCRTFEIQMNRSSSFDPSLSGTGVPR